MYCPWKRLGKEKHIYIDIYRYRYIYRKHHVLALLPGLAEHSADSNNQHLYAYISFADKLKNWWDFPGNKQTKIITTVIPCSPPHLTLKPCRTTKASQTMLIVEVQCHLGLHIPFSGQASHFFFSCVCCPLQCKGKHFCSQLEKLQQQDMPLSTVFQERKIPYSERRRRNTGFLFLGSWHCAAKSTCLSSTSFPPWLSHILLSFSVWVPFPLSPIPLPSPSVSWSCQGPLQMTLTGNEKKKRKARTWNQATGGEVDIVCLWVLIMKVPLVGDLYGCAFKLCMLHITGNKY